MKKAALVACSNQLMREEYPTVEQLKKILYSMGIEAVESPLLYAGTGQQIGLGKQKADILNQYYKDPSIDAVLDLSGGDMGNEVLPYLNYEAIEKSSKMFFGYSDLTTVINAIHSETSRPGILFQMKTLVWDKSGSQTKLFRDYLSGKDDIFHAEWTVLQGNGTVENLLKKDIVVGGNVRCFLKLSGTKYAPDLTGKVLFLESLGGGIPQISTYFASLYQQGAFAKIKGLLLGTFTQLEREEYELCAYDILKQYLPEYLFTAKTQEIGHDKTSRALRIG